MNIKLVIALVLVSTTSACSTVVGKGAFSQEAGRILIDADEKGMRAFSDLIAGSITTGKATPDKETAHHQLRKVQSQVELQKFQAQFTSDSFSGQ